MKRNQLGEGTSFHLGSRRRRQAGCGYGMIWAIVIHCPVKPGRNDTKLQPLVPWWCSVRWSFRVTGTWESSRWRGLPGLGEGRGSTGEGTKKSSLWLAGWETIMNLFDFRAKFSVANEARGSTAVSDTFAIWCGSTDSDNFEFNGEEC